MEIKRKNVKKLFMNIFALTFLVLTLSMVSALTITSVSTTPAQVSPGGTVRLSMDVTNNLNERIENVNIMLDLSNPLLPVAPYESSSEKSFDKIAKDSDESIEFQLIVLPQAPAGIYKIPIKMTYTLNDVPQEKTSVVSIVVNSETKITVVSDGSLVQGRESKVNIKIVNNGLNDIKFLSVEAQNPTSVVINPPLYNYIGTISSDDFDSVDYTIKATDMNSKSVSLPLTIKYKDSTNKDYVKTETVTIPVYTVKEAQDRGLISKSKAGLYFTIILIIVIIYVVYRVRKSRKKRTA